MTMRDLIAAASFAVQAHQWLRDGRGGVTPEAAEGMREEAEAVAELWEEAASAAGASDDERCEWCGDYVNNGHSHGEDRCFDKATGEPPRRCIHCGMLMDSEHRLGCIWHDPEPDNK